VFVVAIVLKVSKGDFEAAIKPLAQAIAPLLQERGTGVRCRGAGRDEV